MGRSDCRNEYVIVVEEGLSSFDRVLCQLRVSGADMMMTVEVRLPASDCEFFQLLDVRHSCRGINVVKR